MHKKNIYKDASSKRQKEIQHYTKLQIVMQLLRDPVQKMEGTDLSGKHLFKCLIGQR